MCTLLMFALTTHCALAFSLRVAAELCGGCWQHHTVSCSALTMCLHEQVREIDVAEDLVRDYDAGLEYAEAECIERERVYEMQLQYLLR